MDEKTWYKNGKKYTTSSGLTEGDTSGLVIIKENNAEAIAHAIDAAVARSLEMIGLLAEGYAKKKCPVDTGRLRNSITHVVDTIWGDVYIGTNVEYAQYVELGTSKQEAQPFLRPAAQDHTTQYRSILKGELGGS